MATCEHCDGHEHMKTAEIWPTLAWVGYQLPLAATGSLLELRDAPCGSTILRRVPVRPGNMLDFALRANVYAQAGDTVSQEECLYLAIRRAEVRFLDACDREEARR